MHFYMTNRRILFRMHEQLKYCFTGGKRTRLFYHTDKSTMETREMRIIHNLIINYTLLSRTTFVRSISNARRLYVRAQYNKVLRSELLRPLFASNQNREIYTDRARKKN